MQNSETQAPQKDNKLGTMPVGKLLAVMSIPTMFSMLIQALYNIVDSIFVSHYSEVALTAVSLAFPLQMLMFSFAVGTNVGVCSVISRRLGEKRFDEAGKAAQSGYTLVLILTVVFVLIGTFLSGPFFRLYTRETELLSLSTTYARICLMLSLGTFVNIYCEKALMATGDTIHPMIIQASGAIFNVIFDPILIFGYLGFPAMGISGAAIATVAGQLFAMVLGIIFLKRNRNLNVKLLKPGLDGASVKDIVVVGLPAVIMQGIGTVMTSLMNAILITFDVLATTVFGVYFKLQSFVFMPVFGLNSGVMPILGYNYGAKNRPRMMKALKMGLAVAILLMSLGTLFFNLFPDTLLGMFNASDTLRTMGEVALRTISLSFPLAAVSVIFGALFQAMGDGYFSMIVSIVRQLFVLIPCAWLLGKISGLDAVWYAFLVAESVALLLSIIFFRRELKKLNF